MLATLSKNNYRSFIITFRRDFDLQFLSRIFRSDISKKFNSNLLRIALNLNEDKVAAFLVARYPVQVDEQVMDFAMQHRSLLFIQ